MKAARWLKDNWINAALGLLVVSLLSYSWMFKKVSVPNERTRIYLSVAMVDDGTVCIDGPVKRFGRIMDIASHEGRFYTDKAPGSSLLGAALYGAVRIFTEPDDWSVEELSNLMRTWLMIPIGLLGFFLLRRLLRSLGMSSQTADIASLGWILGTSAFHYSTAFYGHQMVSVALLAALLLIEEATKSTRKSVPWLLFLAAGALAGFAGLSEYQSAVACLLLTAYVVTISIKNPERIAAFLLGAAPFAGLLLAYNRLAFGGFFELSYEHLVSARVQAMHTEGIAGVAKPYAEAAFGGLLSLHWGFFTTSPMFLLTPVGIFFAAKNKRARLSALLALTVVYYLLLVSGAQNWKAGWSFGPRLVVPAMAFAAILAAYAIEGLRKYWLPSGLAIGFVIVGILYHQIVHLVFPELPKEIMNPLLDVVYPALEQGRVSPNLVSKILGAKGVASIVPALILTIVACAIVFWRGLAAINGLLKKALLAAITPILIAVFIAIVNSAGPSWSESSAARFVKHMENWEQKENG